jgi:CheY-like chemotaxis protein
MTKIENSRILVVDDDPLMRKYVCTVLSRLGVAECRDCADGVAALKEVASFKPDVVLTDIHMEPMGGLEFVRQLRESISIELRKTRVIFMSADSSKATLEEALPLGTFGYIVKPPRPETLRSKLELALKA